MRRAVCFIWVLFFAVFCGRKPHALEVSFWYWNIPYHLSQEQNAQLKEMGVKRLFVRAGTFTGSRGGVQIILPQQWSKGEKPFPAVLVFNFDSGLLTHFGSLDTVRVSTDMASEIQRQATYAAGNGVQVQGVQLDIDCPTRLLNKYGDILGQVRGGLSHKDWSFSATALTSWLYNPKIASITKQVDFLAPEFYERSVPLHLNDPSTISDLRGLQHGLNQCASLGVPFYAGVASYGRAILYDDRGQFASIYHGLTPEDALRHPSFQFESSEPLDQSGNIATDKTYVGEDKLTLLATKNAASGKGAGYHLVYDLPTPQLVSAQDKVLADNAPDNCLGTIIYRLPDEGDPLALPAYSVGAALRNEPISAELAVKFSEEKPAFHQVSLADASGTFDVSVTNRGTAATVAAPGAVQVLIRLNKNGLVSVSLGGFDEATPGVYRSGSFVPTTTTLADAVLLRRSQLLPGATVTAQLVLRSGCKPISTLSKMANSGHEIK